MNKIMGVVIFAGVVLTGCSPLVPSSDQVGSEKPHKENDQIVQNEIKQPEAQVADIANSEISDGEATFVADVWADNWFALYVNGQKVGEDSVPITTERSFNKETISFSAERPLTIAIEAKDFKENDTGLEYINTNRQQMGDGGVIMQIKDSSGKVVATTGEGWKSLVTHKAPLNKECEKSNNPENNCKFEVVDTPNDWWTIGYDDTSWVTASIHKADDVEPKIGYDDVAWDQSAKFIWGSDLEQDNTVLLRSVIQ